MAGAVTGSGFMSRTERETEYIPTEDHCSRGHCQQDARLIAFLRTLSGELQEGVRQG